ncbi:quinon protein alcohol dehydrogenase-like superfamily [Tribonema minus]|uniref:Quinon protein alcohol dehydrogenase-like superfamily n=1 Tax=Tribonema minus TaxID=303371 RepID=A0A836CFC2_9STRA|nr:quinon protein alcohol dehydrogenase-like superfamily [Tribonema minus]
MAVGVADKSVYVYDVISGAQKLCMEGDNGVPHGGEAGFFRSEVLSGQPSAAGRVYISGTNNGVVKFTDLATGAVTQIRGHGYGVGVGLVALASGDDAIAATALYGRSPLKGTTVVVWNTRAPQSAASSFIVDRPLWCAALSPDGRYFYGGGEETALEVEAALEAETCARSRRRRRCRRPEGVIVVYATGKRRGGGGGGGGGGASVRAVLRGHGLCVKTLCVSDDGALLLSASWDGTARIWAAHHSGSSARAAGAAAAAAAAAATGGECLHRLCRSGGGGGGNSSSGGRRGSGGGGADGGRGICTAAFARGREWAVTGACDGAFHIWCARSGRCLASLDTPDFTRARAPVPLAVGGAARQLLALAIGNCAHVLDLGVLYEEARARGVGDTGLGEYLRCSLRYLLKARSAAAEAVPGGRGAAAKAPS